jgi:hypothetical protein
MTVRLVARNAGRARQRTGVIFRRVGRAIEPARRESPFIDPSTIGAFTPQRRADAAALQRAQGSG